MATKIISVQDRQAAGAGDDLQLQAGSGSGAFGGGSVILQGGLQGSSGGDGKVVVRLRPNQTGNLQEWQTAASGALVSIDPSGRLALGPSAAGAGNTNELRFLELAANGSNYVGFKAPDNIASNQTWTLPAADGTSGQYLGTNGAGALSWNTVSGGAGGTVTSVALSLPAIFSVTGSPVQSSGTLTGSLASQNANLVFAGPTTGVASAPTFRSLVAADLPTITSLGTVTAGTWNATTIGIAYGGTGAASKASAFNALTPMTTLGDTEYHDGTNGVRLAGNTTTTKQFLSQTGNGTVSAAPSWSTVSKADVGLGSVENTALSTWAGSANITTLGTVGTGTWNATTIGTSKGGTGLTSIGTANQVLGVNSGATGLEYKTLTAGSNVSITHGANSVTIAASGTVTSVALSLPAIFSVTGSPVQSSGTLTGTLANQSANLVFAGPSGGAATTPGFRSLVAADLPTITSLGTVTAGTWNATAVGITYGGTGQTSAAAAFNALSPITTLGDIIYGSGTNAATRLAGNTTATKQFLSQTGTGTASAAPSWSTVSKSDVGLANVENTALSTWAGSTNLITLGTVGTGTWNATAIGVAKGGTNLTTYTAGDLLYASAATTLTKLGIGTSGQVLTSNGTAPYWATATGGGGASVTVSDTAPASPSAGNLWWESSTGTLKIYYNDGTSSQWVDTVPAASSIGGVLDSVELKNYAETQTAPAISAGDLTINLADGNTFTVSLNADITSLSITNVPTGSKAVSFTLLFTADGTARTVTWPASVKWPNGTAPTLTSTLNKVDIYTFLSVDNGTTWYGMQAGKNF